MATILSIGKLDPRGFAGITRDVITATEHGVDTRSVATYCVSPEDGAFHPFAVSLVQAQLSHLLTPDVSCLKIGALVTAEMMDLIGDFIEQQVLPRHITIILEPVMTSARGKKMVMEPEAMRAYERRLFHRAHLLCPNISEAQRLTGLEIRDLESMRHAADMLMTLGNSAVLLTGGSLIGDVVFDIFASENGVLTYSSPRYGDRSPEGTGDALTAAIAANIALGLSLDEAVRQGREYTRKGIHDYATACLDSSPDSLQRGA
ncbi:MAG: hydroxymethylpyrimidine/phosphomethylpyrimidine kinase [Holosporales bacterium]